MHNPLAGSPEKLEELEESPYKVEARMMEEERPAHLREESHLPPKMETMPTTKPVDMAKMIKKQVHEEVVIPRMPTEVPAKEQGLMGVLTFLTKATSLK